MVLDVLLYTHFNLVEDIGSRNRELDFYASGEFHLQKETQIFLIIFMFLNKQLVHCQC